MGPEMGVRSETPAKNQDPERLYPKQKDKAQNISSSTMSGIHI